MNGRNHPALPVSKNPFPPMPAWSRPQKEALDACGVRSGKGLRSICWPGWIMVVGEVLSIVRLGWACGKSWMYCWGFVWAK